jgi:hypothetical protein
LADRRKGSVTLRMVRGVVGSMERAVVINGWVVVVFTMEVKFDCQIERRQCDMS